MWPEKKNQLPLVFEISIVPFSRNSRTFSSVFVSFRQFSSVFVSFRQFSSVADEKQNDEKSYFKMDMDVVNFLYFMFFIIIHCRLDPPRSACVVIKIYRYFHFFVSFRQFSSVPDEKVREFLEICTIDISKTRGN